MSSIFIVDHHGMIEICILSFIAEKWGKVWFFGYVFFLPHRYKIKYCWTSIRIWTKPMTLPEPGKLADLDFDWKNENWSKNDLPTPQYANLTPLRGKFFCACDMKTLLLLGCLLDLVTTPYGEKSPGLWNLGPPGGSKGGSWGSKNKVWLKMLKIAQFFEKSGYLDFENF